MGVDPETAPRATVSLGVVATGGGLARATTLLTLSLAGVPAPPTSRDAMTVFGCAGYVAGIPNSDSLQQFGSVFVGAWVGQICTQTLAQGDGWFVLEVPSACPPLELREGVGVRFTAGGLDACTAKPFHRGTRVFVELFGRRSSPGGCHAPQLF